jgi:hypothetical protein
MRKLAKAPAKPLPTVETAKGTSAHVDPYPIIDRVERVRWFGTATGKAHAFLVPEGDLPEGKLRAMCPATLDSARLQPRTTDKCKTCAALGADDTRKRGTGLSEPTVDPVDTGAQHGDPRDAEQRRVVEIRPLSREADKINSAIGEQLTNGDREGARDNARLLDARSRETSAQLDRMAPGKGVPVAETAPIGQRDHGMLNGVAMVQGPNTAPVQPMRRNKRTGALEPKAAYLSGSLRERVDPTVLLRDQPKRTAESKRRYRARLNAERKAAERRAQGGK